MITRLENLLMVLAGLAQEIVSLCTLLCWCPRWRLDVCRWVTQKRLQRIRR